MIKGGRGQQLSMFMTAGEITRRYQPLDADMSFMEPEYDDEYNRTLSSVGPHGTENEPAQEYARGSADSGYQLRRVRNTQGQPMFNRSYTPSEDDFWERKAEEIEYDQRGYDDDTGQTLFESVAERGVDYPVHLGTESGQFGKPQIVGGHHRIRAAMENPDMLIPVLHHRNIHHARESSRPWGGYR